MSGLSKSDINSAFSISPNLSTAQYSDIEDNGVLLSIDADQFVCLEGDRCALLPFVIEGTVRVYKIGENGRELTLYRINSGESCILTASCILSSQQFPAHAKVERTVRAIGIPSDLILDWTEKHEVWRRFMFSMMSSRLGDVIELVDAVTFKRLDVRLAEYLLKAGSGDTELSITHQDLASDLGSAREVISRVLKDFEQRGLVKLKRGQIIFIDPAQLKDISQMI